MPTMKKNDHGKEADRRSPAHDTLSEEIPEEIRQMFDDELVLSGECRRLLVTIGQFSIVRLERDAQLVVPVMDYSIPCKECCEGQGFGEYLPSIWR